MGHVRPPPKARGTGTHLLIDDGVDLHGLDDIRHELRVDERVPDLLVQQHAHTASKLGGDLLGLVRHL